MAGLRDPGATSPEAVELARSLGLSFTVAEVLVRAGYGPDERTNRFLDPKLAQLTPPDAMAGRDAAVDRLAHAIAERERVAVFGDYDCDGITSTAIVTEVLRELGGDVVPLLGSRFAGGYGLTAAALERALGTGARLLVTCDCGSTDHERVAGARAAGIDVVVIDHHLGPGEPPPATAFVNPRQPGCGFAYKGMAACGLTLLVAAGLRRKLDAPLDIRRWLDLVAIGTVADVAPLDGDNRILVRAGLALLQSPARPGVRALLDRARRGKELPVRAEDIAFQIAPRLNAPGRLGDPMVALELLLERDPVRATELAALVEELAAERRRIQSAMLAEALAEIARAGLDSGPAIVLARAGWHPGVVGIVAGRLADQYGRPAAVVALDGQSGRGSARAPAGFPLYDSLARCADTLEAFGGHQAAAGLELRADSVERFRAQWHEACVGLGACELPGGPRRVAADVRLDPRDDLVHVVADLERLEPCGQGNAAPRVLFGGARVRSARDVGGHLKLELQLQGTRLGGFGPNQGARAGELTGQELELVGRLRPDAWRGGQAMEVLVEDWERS
jgi:single-stranded-DNA-specific exonuclease